MRDDVFVEHRGLHAILSEVRASLHDRRASADGLERLTAAFDVHFAQEERLYYPAISSLRPELQMRLRGISERHAGFRAQLRRVHALLDEGAVPAAREALASLSSDFEEHEREEEQLLSALDRESEPAP